MSGTAILYINVQYHIYIHIQYHIQLHLGSKGYCIIRHCILNSVSYNTLFV